MEGVEAGSQTQLPPVEPATRDAFSGGVNIETWSKYQTLLAFVFLLILRISLSLSLSLSASLRRIMDVCFLSGFLDFNTFFYYVIFIFVFADHMNTGFWNLLYSVNLQSRIVVAMNIVILREIKTCDRGILELGRNRKNEILWLIHITVIKFVNILK